MTTRKPKSRMEEKGPSLIGRDYAEQHYLDGQASLEFHNKGNGYPAETIHRDWAPDNSCQNREDLYAPTRRRDINSLAALGGTLATGLTMAAVQPSHPVNHYVEAAALLILSAGAISAMGAGLFQDVFSPAYRRRK